MRRFEPDEMGPWGLRLVESIGDAYTVEGFGPMSPSIAEEVYERLDFAEPVERPFEFERRFVVEREGEVVRGVVIAFGEAAVLALVLADAVNGVDCDARWERADEELARSKAP